MTGAARSERVVITQGGYWVSARPDVVFCTLLGSCVAMCLHDPIARIGGLNHFLLPGTAATQDDEGSPRYGAHAMDLLVSAMVAQGAVRRNFRAKLFGGAHMLAGLADLGAQNAAFAEWYLWRAGIPLVGGSLGGERSRRIEFWPSTGRTRQRLVGDPAAAGPAREPAAVS